MAGGGVTVARGGGVVRIRETERQRLLSVLRVCAAAVEAVSRLPQSAAALARSRGDPGGGGDGGGCGAEDAEHRITSLTAERKTLLQTLALAMSLLQNKMDCKGDEVSSETALPSGQSPEISALPPSTKKIRFQDTLKDRQVRPSNLQCNALPKPRLNSTYKEGERKEKNLNKNEASRLLKTTSKFREERQTYSCPQIPRGILKDSSQITNRVTSAQRTLSFLKNPGRTNRIYDGYQQTSKQHTTTATFEKRCNNMKAREMTFLLPSSSYNKKPVTHNQLSVDLRHSSAHARLCNQATQPNKAKLRNIQSATISVKVEKKDKIKQSYPTANSPSSAMSDSSSDFPEATCFRGTPHAHAHSLTFARRICSQPLPTTAKPTSALPSSSNRTPFSKSDHQRRSLLLSKTNQQERRVEKATIGDFHARKVLRKPQTKLASDISTNFRNRYSQLADFVSPKKATSESKWCAHKTMQREKTMTLNTRANRSAPVNVMKIKREKTFDLPNAPFRKFI